MFSNLKNMESLDLSYNELNGENPCQLNVLNFLAIFNVSYNSLTRRMPQRTTEFGSFDWDSYVGNPLLCREPLPRHCFGIDSPPSTPRATIGSGGDFCFIDRGAFYVSFAGSYTTILLAITTILFINPH